MPVIQTPADKAPPAAILKAKSPVESTKSEKPATTQTSSPLPRGSSGLSDQLRLSSNLREEPVSGEKMDVDCGPQEETPRQEERKTAEIDTDDVKDVETVEEESDEDEELEMELEEEGNDEQEIEESEDEDETVELPTRPITVEDVIIHIPPNIKQNLIDDCEVLRIGYLPKLPVSVTIDEIVKQYEHHICPDGAIEEQLKDRTIECKEITDETKFPEGVYILAVQSIATYFNNVCRFLLFPPECEQFDRLVADDGWKAEATTADIDFRPSAFYGFQHLIRTITTLPEHIAQQEWNDHMLKTLLHAFNHFFAWLDGNFDRFFSRDDYYVYIPALEVTRNNVPS